MADLKKSYTKDNLKVIWEPSKCIHSGICARGLAEVFKPSERPWINLENASVKEITTQIDACPSGALSYEMEGQTNDSALKQLPVLEVVPGGPIILKSSCRVVMKDGSEEMKENRVALCRCGASSNKPYCDGNHKTIDFDA